MIDIEQFARRAGADAWDIGKDAQGRLTISLDGVDLLPELKLFAALVAASEREMMRKESEA